MAQRTRHQRAIHRAPGHQPRTRSEASQEQPARDAARRSASVSVPGLTSPGGAKEPQTARELLHGTSFPEQRVDRLDRGCGCRHRQPGPAEAQGVSQWSEHGYRSTRHRHRLVRHRHCRLRHHHPASRPAVQVHGGRLQDGSPELAGVETAASNAVSTASEHHRRAGGRSGVRAAPGWGTTQS